MANSLVVSMLGAPIGIEFADLDAATRDEVCAAWADALALDCAAPVTSVRVDPTLDRARAFELLSQHVTLAGIRAHRGRMWMLHAAGVADKDGRVLVFVGPSGRGKTTASIALGREFGYVSDETIGIAADGTIWAYRKPLSIIEERGRPKVQRAPSSLGVKPLPAAPLRLAGIVLLDRRDDAGEHPDVGDISLAEAIDELVPQSSSLTAMDAPLQYIARVLEATGGLRRVTYREAASLPGVVREVFQAPSIPTRIGTVDEARPVLRADDDPAASRYSRADVIDAIATDDPEAAILLQAGRADGEGIARVLAGIAPTLWRAADGATEAQLVDAAVAVYGDPPDGDAPALVRAALRELVDSGVLVAE